MTFGSPQRAQRAQRKKRKEMPYPVLWWVVRERFIGDWVRDCLLIDFKVIKLVDDMETFKL